VRFAVGDDENKQGKERKRTGKEMIKGRKGEEEKGKVQK